MSRKNKSASPAASVSPVKSGGPAVPVWAIGLALFVVTLGLSWPVTGFNFINCDDPEYFSANPHILGGLTWPQIKWAFSTVYFGNWLPLTWLSLMLDAQFFGPGAAGPHFTNLLLHAVNVVLVFLTVRELTGAMWRSALVAALFGLHPLRVESFAWVAERRDVLCAFFSLLSLWWYSKWVTGDEWRVTWRGTSPSPATRHPSQYWLALLCFAAALMSKAMAVTLPCVLLLLDFWPLQRMRNAENGVRNWGRLVLEKIPFFTMSAALAALTFYAQKSAGALPVLGRLSLGDRVGNALVSYVRYLGKTFWPVDLAMPYPHPGHWPLGLVLGAVVVLAVISVGAFLVRKSAPFAWVGWCWFAGMLVPVSGLIQTGAQAMADRFTYLPHVGLLLALVWGAELLLARWRPFAAVLAVIAMVALAVRTHQQVPHWRDSETLFRHALAVTPNNFFAHNGLGVELAARGQADAAMAEYHAALQASPEFAPALANLGNVLAARGQMAEALALFEQAVASDANQPSAHNNLANALAANGRLGEAEQAFRRALALQSDFTDARCGLGNLLAMEGHLDAAVAEYQTALRTDPHHVAAHQNLGYTYTLLGKPAEAVTEFQAAAQHKPADAPLHLQLALALAQAGRRAEALAALEAAAKLNPALPGLTEARQRLTSSTP